MNPALLCPSIVNSIHTGCRFSLSEAVSYFIFLPGIFIYVHPGFTRQAYKLLCPKIIKMDILSVKMGKRVDQRQVPWKRKRENSKRERRLLGGLTKFPKVQEMQENIFCIMTKYFWVITLRIGGNFGETDGKYK